VADLTVHDRWMLWAKAFLKLDGALAKRKRLAYELDLDPDLLYQAVQSYVFDIHRHKAFHFTDDPLKKADDVKQFAFTLYWLMKLRPVIAVGRSTTGKSLSMTSTHRDPTLLANAYFAWIVASNHQPGILKGKLLFELLYAMTYREIGKDGYLMVASMIKRFTEHGVSDGILKTLPGPRETL
jgi:hypothetical protein